MCVSVILCLCVMCVECDLMCAVSVHACVCVCLCVLMCVCVCVCVVVLPLLDLHKRQKCEWSLCGHVCWHLAGFGDLCSVGGVGAAV